MCLMKFDQRARDVSPGRAQPAGGLAVVALRRRDVSRGAVGRRRRPHATTTTAVGLLLLPFSLAALWFSLAYWTRELPRPVAVLLKWLGVVGWICGMLFYLMWMHSVLRFTKH